MSLTPELREFAEDPGRFVDEPRSSSVERVVDDRVCLVHGATWSVISGVNIEPDELDRLIAQVRQWVPPESEPTWYMGPSTRPPDLFERLEARGFTSPRDGVGLIHALALAGEPNAPSDVEVVRITTFEQFRQSNELAWDAFETPEDHREKNRARLAQDFEESMRNGVPVSFLATLDGRPAGTATAITSDRGVFLVGGATASWARSRGVYRALVRARWDYAVSRGTPALVTHAVPDTSYPILLGIGFEEVCTIRRLQDPTG
ncbi:MAG TPA: hypothetical protein VKR27_05635 [Acidimicrobiales bacterium]|nr:hypothetical protein [Acidimicrobiales bacterium]